MKAADIGDFRWTSAVRPGPASVERDTLQQQEVEVLKTCRPFLESNRTEEAVVSLGGVAACSELMVHFSNPPHTVRHTHLSQNSLYPQTPLTFPPSQ